MLTKAWQSLYRQKLVDMDAGDAQVAWLGSHLLSQVHSLCGWHVGALLCCLSIRKTVDMHGDWALFRP